MSKKPMQKFMDWLQYKVTPAVQKFTERPWCSPTSPTSCPT